MSLPFLPFLKSPSHNSLSQQNGTRVDLKSYRQDGHVTRHWELRGEMKTTNPPPPKKNHNGGRTMESLMKWQFSLIARVVVDDGSNDISELFWPQSTEQKHQEMENKEAEAETSQHHGDDVCGSQTSNSQSQQRVWRQMLTYDEVRFVPLCLAG